MANLKHAKAHALIEQLNMDISQFCPYARFLLYSGMLVDRIVIGDVLRHSDACPICANSLRENLRHVNVMRLFSMLKELF